MCIYLKNKWVLFILKMSGFRGSPYTTYFNVNKTGILSSQHLCVCVILRINWEYNLHTINQVHIPSLQKVSLVHPKCYQRIHDYRWKFWKPVRLIVWSLLMCYIRMVWDIFGCEPHVCDAYSARHWRCAKHLLRCHLACFGLDIFIQIGKRYCAALSRHGQCSSLTYRR